MQVVIPGRANIVSYDVTAKSNGNPITVGTVNFYLVADTGTHAGRWFRASDSSWQAVKSSAGTGTFIDGAKWNCSIVAAAWEYGTSYSLYAEESGNLNIVYTDQIIPSLAIGVVGAGNNRWPYRVLDGSGDPVADVTVRLALDADGTDIIYQDVTDVEGYVYFYVRKGLTVYLFRSKVDWEFDDPDIEVVD
jgi:hypothetical protein